jgi:hypothetical protein
MITQPVVTYKHVEDILIAAMPLRGTCAQAPATFRLLQEQVWPYVAGKRMLLYYYAASNTRVECCLAVSRPVNTAEVRSYILTGGEALTLIHLGPYRTLGESWSLLFDHIEGHNIRIQGPRREVYMDEREFTAPVHLTELQVLVAP